MRRAVPSLLRQTLQDANSLTSILHRSYSTRTRARPIHSSQISNNNVEDRFKREFDSAAQELMQHRALNHDFFQFLKEQSQSNGFNARQFVIYRDNFFYRTELTMPSVARAIEKAALSGDFQTVADMVRNIYDEGGYGDPNKVHSRLLLDSHNEHGEKIFGIDRLERLKDVKKSMFLLPATHEYRKSKIAVFNKSYPYIAGNTWAHELAADGMLDNFRKAFFDAYAGYYGAPENYKRVIGFYEAHRNDDVKDGDVELQHERMARSTIERICTQNIDNIPKILEGAIEFLDRQSDLWSEMMNAIEKAKDKGVPVLPRRTFIKIEEIKDDDVPNTSVASASSEQPTTSRIFDGRK